MRQEGSEEGEESAGEHYEGEEGVVPRLHAVVGGGVEEEEHALVEKCSRGDEVEGARGKGKDTGREAEGCGRRGEERENGADTRMFLRKWKEVVKCDTRIKSFSIYGLFLIGAVYQA